MTIVTCLNCGAKNRVDERAENLQPVCGRCGTRLSVPAAAHGASGEPLVVSDASFARDVLGAGERPVLVDCWAAWCGPCRMIAPTVDKLAAEAGGRWVVAKLDVDANPQTSQRFQISSIPTLLIFKGGKLVDRIVGLQPKQAIEARLSALAPARV